MVDQSRHRYDLFVSETVLRECRRGDREMVESRLAIIAGCEDAPESVTVLSLAFELLEVMSLPPDASDDALHVAVSAGTQINLLLTWNLKHLANPAKQATIRRRCIKHGYNAPVILTPKELMALELRDGNS